MKKTILYLIFIICLVQISLAEVTIENTCYFGDLEPYSFVDRFNRADNTNLGNAERPALAWVEALGDAEIKDNSAYLESGAGAEAIELDNIVNYVNESFVWEIAITPITLADYWQMWLYSEGSVMINFETFGDGSVKYYDGGSATDSGIDMSNGVYYRFKVFGDINTDKWNFTMYDIDGVILHSAQDLDFQNGAVAASVNKIYIYKTTDVSGIYAVNSSYIINGTDGCPTETPPPIIEHFLITALDALNQTALQEFNVTVNGTFFNTSSGTINTSIIKNDTTILNITVVANSYLNKTYLYWNSDIGLQANLTKKYILEDIAFSNIFNYSSINITRNISYSIDFICQSDSNTTLIRSINSTANKQTQITCTNVSQTITDYYQHPKEGTYTLGFILNVSEDNPNNNLNIKDYSFVSDLYPPSINLYFNVSEGFIKTNITLNITCYDNITPLLSYESYFNTNLIYFENATTNTTISNFTTGKNGVNSYLGICSDDFDSTNETINRTIFSKNLILIDEKTGLIFNCTNITRCRVYSDDNHTFYDFKNETKNQINFTGVDFSRLRFDFGYINDVTITRWVDVSLLTGDSLRICVNTEGTTHFEQLVISATEREAILTNVFADCTIGVEYTRFAYQDALVLRAFTIPSLYYLYTFDSDGNQILLSSLDGSVSTYINLDTLEFKQEGFALDILRDALSFEKTADTQITLFYQNIKNDNTAVRLIIENMDVNTDVLDTSTFSNPNEWTVIFDYSTLSNVSNTTLFKATVTTTKNDGSTDTFKRYFNIFGSTGLISSGLALTLSVLLLIFGFSITASRTAFSWFGIVIVIASMGILSFAISTWYITFMMGLNVIILVYTIITLVNLNYQTLT